MVNAGLKAADKKTTTICWVFINPAKNWQKIQINGYEDVYFKPFEIYWSKICYIMFLWDIDGINYHVWGDMVSFCSQHYNFQMQKYGQKKQFIGTAVAIFQCELL